MASKAILYFLLATFICNCIQQTNGYRRFLKKIPNGENVPHPCKKNTMWSGVGHLNEFGGGKRNSFGYAFRQAGFKWTKQLCQEDSDNDGKTNGEELGDPGCIWSEGQTPSRLTSITHPGICEPVDSPKCNFQTWVSCSGKKANCSGRTEPGVLKRDIRFPRYNVPAKLTNYFCKTFRLPNDTDYHIVASDPILDNTKVIHHMILYGCSKDVNVEKEPFNCIMGQTDCQDMLVGWTVGEEGQCFPKEAGYRIGKTGYRYVQLQMHWTNDLKETNLYDSSGLTIYYTPNMRQYDMGTIVTGQLLLELPPKKSEITAEGICKPYCTNAIFERNGTVKVSGASLHAHFLGKSLSLAQYRNGKFIRYLAKDDVFSYNNPMSTIFNPAVELHPGDELRTTCKYDTTKRTTTTYYGDGTYDEMCFGFVEYYPKVKYDQFCVSYDRYSFCDLYYFQNGSLYDHNIGTCNFTEFDSHKYPSRILRVCGQDPKSCPKDCKQLVDEMSNHRCRKGFEKKAQDGMLWTASNATALAMWKAINVCATKTGVDSSGIAIHPAGLSLVILGLLSVFQGHFL